METSPTHLPSTLQAQGEQALLATHRHPWVHPHSHRTCHQLGCKDWHGSGSRHSGTLALPVDHLQAASPACHRLLVTFRLLWGYGECRPSEPNTLTDPLGMTTWLALPPAARLPCPALPLHWKTIHASSFLPCLCPQNAAHKQSQAGCGRHRTVFLLKKKRLKQK